MDVNEAEKAEKVEGLPLTTKKPVEEKWYAIYTNPRAEKQVYQRLIEEGVETFLPLQKAYRVWSDRKKLIEKPLIPSYLFVRILVKNFHHVYKQQGVVKFISFEGKPVSIPSKQIDNLKLLVNSDAKIELSSEIFAKGDNVEVISGSLVGLTGELIRVGNQNRVVIRIDRLDQNLLLKIPKAFLRKV
ncbi:MAG: UpxY family transcription antiterminator [Bacteroidales bacterium]|nr:UpxY family transcription antiterminator [Bacteroidales bacterium]